MQPFSAPLRDHPQAKQLLENQAAIRQMLANPETQKLLRSLQKKNAGQHKIRTNPEEFHLPAVCASGAGAVHLYGGNPVF